MTGPRVLFDDAVKVSDGQLYLTPDISLVPGAEMAFAGQVNGLCGAAVPGALYLVTGLRQGSVKLTVERYSEEPDLDESWEEAVEVSLVSPSDGMVLSNSEGDTWPVPVPAGSHRVRYCARGMQVGWDLETSDDVVSAERYLLALWPAVSGQERILRQTSEIASYWHGELGTTTLDDIGSDRLSSVRVGLSVLKAWDPNVVDALARADDSTHHEVARWAALQTLSVAGMLDSPVLQEVVTNLRNGVPVPPPFDDEITVMRAPTRSFRRTRVAPVPGLDTEFGQPVRELGALASVAATAIPDSLESVLYALTQAVAAHGPDHSGELLETLYTIFPGLRA
jgi:hypothetical protein